MSEYECKRCGGLLMQSQGEFCNKCIDKNHEDIVLIRDVMQEMKVNDLATISRKTGISIKIINMLARNNYIVFSIDD